MKRFTEFYKSHDNLTENVPFTNHKNKYFIVQMVHYIMVHVSSELPVKIYINFKIGL